MQTRVESLVEAVANTVIGFFVALLTQAIVFPFFNIYTTVADDVSIASIFTAVSIARTYVVRRLFNFFRSDLK